MSGLEFTPLAEQDLIEILTYIAQDNPSAGLAFVDRLRKTCGNIAKQPLLGQARPEFARGQYRCFPVGNYVIYYKPLKDGAVIVRVLHGARDHDALL